MSTKTKSTNCRDLTLTNCSFGSLYSFGVGVGSDAVNEMQKQELVLHKFVINHLYTLDH